MSERILNAMRDLIQEDIGQRGLRTDPEDNLITACQDDFAGACRSLANTTDAAIVVIAGFLIPHAQPPCGETDGPLGAVFLARALVPLGIRVSLVTDHFCADALHVGLELCGLNNEVPVITLSPSADLVHMAKPGLTHLVALERVGPSHSPRSIASQPGCATMTEKRFHQEVPAEHHDRYYTMRGRDITSEMAPAHLLVEAARNRLPPLVTIGIGDGGNEIGMGKIPWEIIRRNIPNGGKIACRVPTDHLIVCGVSNWGAYGLGAGVRYLRQMTQDDDLFSVTREREILRVMVEKGRLVDGVTGQPAVAVDGLPFEAYAKPLGRLKELLDHG